MAFLPVVSIGVLGLASKSGGHEFRVGDIAIGHPWCRPAAQGTTAAVGLALVNRGEAADRLVGAETPIAAAARLLEAAEPGGRVRPLAGVELAPRRPVALRHGRRWIAVESLARPLGAGDAFVLTLVFARAGRIAVEVAVEAEGSH